MKTRQRITHGVTIGWTTAALLSCSQPESETRQSAPSASEDVSASVAPGATGEAAESQAWLLSINGEKLAPEIYRGQGFYFNPLGRWESDKPRERLESMTDSEVLWQEARRRGVDRRPEVRRQLQQIVINAFLKESVPSGQEDRAVTEEEALAYYEQQKDLYHEPAAVRVAHILFAKSGSNARQRAEELLRDPHLKQPGGFGSGAREQSEDKRSSYRGGDLGFLDVPEPGKPSPYSEWKAALIGKASAEAAIGDIVPEVVETAKGYHLVKLLGRRAARTDAFNQVKDQIVRRLGSQTRARAYRAYVDELKNNADIVVDEERFAQLTAPPDFGAEAVAREKAHAAQLSNRSNRAIGSDHSEQSGRTTGFSRASRSYNDATVKSWV